MLLWLKAHDGSAVNAERVDALTFEEIPVGQNDAEGKPIMQLCVMAMLTGCKIIMQPVPNQQEGLKFIASVCIYIKKEYDRQNKTPQIETSTEEEAAEIAKQAAATKKVLHG